MDDAMLLPASDSSLAWVYEGATPAMTPDDAATAIRAATIGWTRDDHLQMGALQHHLAVALCDDPERQAVCSAAAFMHVAAAGMDPGSLLGKSLDPKVLRPKLGAKPERIGTTRSGKPIYNMFTHPAHASFKTADHVDHIKAMEAHNKGKKMNKAGATPSIIGKTRSNKAIHGPSADGIKNFSADHASHSGDDHVDAWKAHVKQASGISGPANQFHIKMANRHSEAALAAGKSKSSFRVPKHLGWQKSGSLAKSGEGSRQRQETSMYRSEAVSILENFLAKSNNIIGKTSSGFKVRHPSHSDYQTGGTHPKFRFQGLTKKDHEEAAAVHEASPYKGSHNAMMVHRAFASGHVGKLAKSGEGSRGGKVVGHTKAGAPVYARNGANYSHTNSLHKIAEQPTAHHDLHAWADATSKDHPSYTAQDHADAAKIHSNLADRHIGKGREMTNSDSNKDVKNGNLIMRAGYHHEAIAESHRAASHKMRNAEHFGRTAGPVKDYNGSPNAKVPKKMKASDYGKLGKSDIMGFPVDLGDMQGSPIDGNYVDSMGGSHDLFMQQAELANCPTMWAPISAVSDFNGAN